MVLKLYLLSVTFSLILLVIHSATPKDIDLFKALENINESLNNIKNDNMRRILINLINSFIENPNNIYIFYMLIILTPFLNILLGIVILYDLFIIK
jgi:hypothetical protein